MLRTLTAIGFIFAVASAAWLALAGNILSRTHRADDELRSKVQRVWGSPQVQRPPVIGYAIEHHLTEEVERDKKKVQIDRTVSEFAAVPLAGSDVEADLGLQYRQKGLLWYSTYGVRFTGWYKFSNPTPERRVFDVRFALPSQGAVYDGFEFTVAAHEWEGEVTATEGAMVGHITLDPGEAAELHVRYRSQGMDRWTYAVGDGGGQVKDFRLTMLTDFADIDFPDDAIAPLFKQRTEQGWKLGWQYTNLVAGVNIAMVMPQKLQPGPLAGAVSLYAPISLAFFITVLLVIGLVRNIAIHPMHFAFLSGCFFSFHLLFAYLVDLIPLHAAFVVAAIVSVALVVSYLRVVFGARFAFYYAGLAQLVYLVLFSYCFFLRGLTGLTISIGAIITLAAIMHVTARVDWSVVFGRGWREPLIGGQRSSSVPTDPIAHAGPATSH